MGQELVDAPGCLARPQACGHFSQSLSPQPSRAGVTDMVRICDGRMSGTGFGTVVLHVAPEAAAGGPIALVQTGDMIELDVAARTLRLDVPEAELERRRAAWRPRASKATSGYIWLYGEHVMQAGSGADFDFLRGQRGHGVARHSH
jgi:dihydroxy-acid dehydratase